MANYKETEKTQKSITLIDVAKDAKVSPATVSLVLRGSPVVADDTRQKVEVSIEKLGYVYNRAAASLRSQRSNTIGLIIPDITNPFFSELTLGIESHLDGENLSLLLSNSGEDVSKQYRLLETLREHRADGVLFCPAEGTPPETIYSLRKWGLPFVLVARYLLDVEADYIGMGNEIGAEQATQYLISQGHKRICFIGGSAVSSARRDRLLGYKKALANNGCSYDETLLRYSPVTREGGYQAILNLLEHRDQPTAALCYNDIVAFGVMLGLQRAGLIPGRDFSVIGFDDIAEASLSNPPLTTVSVKPRQFGVKAAELILERIKNPKAKARQTNLHPHLVIRESCTTYTGS